MIARFRHHSGFALYVSAKVAGALTTLCVAGVISRSLGPQAFGLLMSASVIPMVFAAIVDGNVIARGIAQWQNDEFQFNGWLYHAIAFRLGAGLISMAGLLFVCELTGWTDYLTLTAGWCLFLIFQPLRLAEIRLIASEDFKLLSKATLWSCGYLIILTTAFSAIGWTRSIWVSLFLIILPVLGSSPYLLITRKLLTTKPGNLKTKLLKREAIQSLSFGTTQGLSMLMDSLPYLILPSFYGHLALGLYAAAAKLIQTYTQGVTLLMPYLLTKLSRNRKHGAGHYYLSSLLLGLLCTLGFLLLGKQAILIVNGSAFAEAGALFLPLSGLIIAIPLGQLCMGMAGLVCRPKLPFLTVLSSFLLLTLFCLLVKPGTVYGFLAVYGLSILLGTIALTFLMRGAEWRDQNSSSPVSLER